MGIWGNQTYWTLGGGIGYGVGFGFELNLGGSYWGGASPTVFKLTPGVTWYAPLPFRPYVGGFYDHWFVSGAFPDQDALGARGGITLVSTGPAFVGLGVAYEHFISSCSTNCDVWWPEATAGFAF